MGMHGWTMEFLSSEVEGEYLALPADMRARLARIGGFIEEFGLHDVGEPHVKHLDGKLWEMRATGRDGIARSIYAALAGRRVIILRVFVKKDRKTPRREMAIALKRLKEVQHGTQADDRS